MHTIFQTETEFTKRKYCKEILNYINSIHTVPNHLPVLALGRMQNKYFVNTRTVLGSAIFGSLNRSIFSGKCIVPILAVLPLILSPLPRIYRGFPIVPIPMQLFSL